MNRIIRGAITPEAKLAGNIAPDEHFRIYGNFGRPKSGREYKIRSGNNKYLVRVRNGNQSYVARASPWL